MGSEYANQNAYDCIQIHGGSGFMRDYTCERLYRDARITSIYEGTTQLQVVAAIRYVTNGSYLSQIKTFEAASVAPEFESLKQRVAAMTEKYAASVAKVEEVKNQCHLDLCARHLVEMAGHIIMSHLLLQSASTDADLFRKTVNVYVRYAESEVQKNSSFVLNLSLEDVELYRH